MQAMHHLSFQEMRLLHSVVALEGEGFSLMSGDRTIISVLDQDGGEVVQFRTGRNPLNQKNSFADWTLPDSTSGILYGVVGFPTSIGWFPQIISKSSCKEM